MLLERIAQNAALRGDAPAYRSASGSLSYAGLWNSACGLADRLAGGSGPMMVCGDKEPLLPAAFLGCLLAGRPFLPCDDSAPPERLARIRQDSGAVTVLAPRPVAGLSGVQVLSPEGLAALAEQSAGCFPIPADDQRDAYWLYTSGSTGRPKGVRISVAALENFVGWMLSLPAVADCADGVTVNQARFSFDLSVADLWPAWAAGGCVRALSREEQSDLSLLYRCLGESGGSRLTGTPSFLRLCLCDPAFCRELLPELKTVFLCGETLPARTAARLHRRFPGVRLLNAYGPTEATCAVCAVEIPPDTAGPLPVGRVSDAACRLLILGPDGRELPDGEPGEIALAGPSVGSGYVGEFAGGFSIREGQPLYCTGDRGEIRDGCLWCAGRIDRQVKYKGYRIEPGEVEQLLAGWPEVQAAAVLPLTLRDEVLGLAAAVEWAGPPLPAEERAARLKAALPDYMHPRRWLELDRMPLTPNGKCDWNELKRRLNDD